jgi:hypothetical protein
VDGMGSKMWSLRPLLLLLGLTLASLSAAPGAAAEDKSKNAVAKADDGPREGEYWFAETIQHGDGGLRVMNIWSKGRKLRAERIVDGAVLQTLVNGDTYYNILPTAGIGVAIQRTPKALADDQKGGRPFGHDVEKMLARGGEKASTERLMGHEVAVYRINSEEAREEVWATTDADQLPIKLVYTDRKDNKSYETMLNWTRGNAVKDSFFEPDPRITLQKLSYEEFLAGVKDGTLTTFPPLFNDLLVGNK